MPCMKLNTSPVTTSQPPQSPNAARWSVACWSVAVGTVAVGTVAVGTVAVGTVAVGTVAVGSAALWTAAGTQFRPGLCSPSGGPSAEPVRCGLAGLPDQPDGSRVAGWPERPDGSRVAWLPERPDRWRRAAPQVSQRPAARRMRAAGRSQAIWPPTSGPKMRVQPVWPQPPPGAPPTLPVSLPVRRPKPL